MFIIHRIQGETCCLTKDQEALSSADDTWKKTPYMKLTI